MRDLIININRIGFGLEGPRSTVKDRTGLGEHTDSGMGLEVHSILALAQCEGLPSTLQDLGDPFSHS
jgi:hypothetical protein